MPRAAAIASHSAWECSRTALLAAQVLIAASLGLPVPASSQATPAAAAEPRQAAPAAAAEPRQARPAAVSGPSTAGRPAMPLAMPSWVELGNYQREALAPLQPVWNGLPAASKRSWLALTEKLPAMQAADREAAQKRIREWAALSPEQRRMARDNFRLAKSLDRDERLATWESYRQLTPEQRTVLRDNGWTSNTAARHAGAATGLFVRELPLDPTDALPVWLLPSEVIDTSISVLDAFTGGTPQSESDLRDRLELALPRGRGAVKFRHQVEVGRVLESARELGWGLDEQGVAGAQHDVADLARHSLAVPMHADDHGAVAGAEPALAHRQPHQRRRRILHRVDRLPRAAVEPVVRNHAVHVRVDARRQGRVARRGQGQYQCRLRAPKRLVLRIPVLEHLADDPLLVVPHPDGD